MNIEQGESKYVVLCTKIQKYSHIEMQAKEDDEEEKRNNLKRTDSYSRYCRAEFMLIEKRSPSAQALSSEMQLEIHKTEAETNETNDKPQK